MVKFSDELRALFEVAVIGVATCSADGIPNVIAISDARILDDDTIAISNQFMNKTAKNLAENPRISVLLIDFPGIRTVQLRGRLERMEDSGPIFEEMSRRIDAIDTEFNLGGLFKLRAAGIVKIHEIFE